MASAFPLLVFAASKSSSRLQTSALVLQLRVRRGRRDRSDGETECTCQKGRSSQQHRCCTPPPPLVLQFTGSTNQHQLMELISHRLRRRLFHPEISRARFLRGFGTRPRAADAFSAEVRRVNSPWTKISLFHAQLFLLIRLGNRSQRSSLQRPFPPNGGHLRSTFFAKVKNENSPHASRAANT